MDMNQLLSNLDPNNPQHQAIFDMMLKNMVSGYMQPGGYKSGANQPQGGSVYPADAGAFKYSTGGPGQPGVVPSHAPSNVIFGGGSPFKVDDGPTIMQNNLVAIRDLLNTPIGQAAISRLKAKMGGQGAP